MSDKYKRNLIIILLFSFMLVCSSCSTNYGKEIVGKWNYEDKIYLVFLDTGDLIFSEFHDGKYPAGYYSVDEDGVVSASMVGITDTYTLQLKKDGADWYMEANDGDEELILKRESTDVSYWADLVSSLDKGDRLEGTTWYATYSNGGFTYLIYEENGIFQMEGQNGFFDSGRYTAYYGKDALEFLRNNASCMWTDIDEFQNTDGTFYADEIICDDGETWIDYGYLNGDVMETAIDGQDHAPVFFYKQ